MNLERAGNVAENQLNSNSYNLKFLIYLNLIRKIMRLYVMHQGFHFLLFLDCQRSEAYSSKLVLINSPDWLLDGFI